MSQEGAVRVITPTTRQFRTMTIVAALSWLTMIVTPHTSLISFSKEVQAVRTWNYFEAAIPFWTIQLWWGISGLLTIYGLVGMLRFWPSARLSLAAALIGSVLAQPLIGLAVYSPFEASLAGVFGASSLWIVSVSFHSPLAHQFHAKKDT